MALTADFGAPGGPTPDGRMRSPALESDVSRERDDIERARSIYTARRGRDRVRAISAGSSFVYQFGSLRLRHAHLLSRMPRPQRGGL